MENPPTISIALCTYNGSDYLRQQLDSVLNQTVTDWELVVVDDCSTDETWEILQEYAARDERFGLHSNDTNLGYNKNFEKALTLCRSELIVICDQDDIWHQEKLEIQLKTIQNHELIYHDSEFIDQSGDKMNIRMSDKFNFYRGNRQEVFLFLNCVSGHSIMMQKRVLSRALPFPAHFHYDQWLAFIATGMGSIDFTDQCLVSYRQHKKNNTDILALNSVKKNKQQKIKQLEEEKEWLRLCLKSGNDKPNELVASLYAECRNRNVTFMNVAYGKLIWENKDILLYLLKKPIVSKAFYTLRKIWGSKAKLIA